MPYDQDEFGDDMTPKNVWYIKGDLPKRPGVKYGTKRGPYKKKNPDPLPEKLKKREKPVKVKEIPQWQKDLDERAEKYVRARVVGGKTQVEAMKIAGITSNNVERFRSVRKAYATIEKEREALQNTPGMTMTDIARRFKNRATGPKVPHNVKNDADKALLNMLNYTPVKQVNINATGMLLEFKDVSMEQLMELRQKRIEEIAEADVVE